MENGCALCITYFPLSIKPVSGNKIMPDFFDHIYGKNLLRFLGKSDEVIEKKLPVMGV